ncbi:MAG: hypothetical protein QME60_01375 [Verrucomicrobiota bacterium]|nr:hypothetical protein [Verrucomicrobiota bacterium]
MTFDQKFLNGAAEEIKIVDHRAVGGSNLGESASPEAEQKPSAPIDQAQSEKTWQIGFVDKAGTLVVEMKLFKMKPIEALGLLVQAQDIVKTWYASFMAAKRAEQQRSLPVRLRESLAKARKLLIPK